MMLSPITDAASWEAFQTQRTWAQFFQSWVWGEFRRSVGCPVLRFALQEGGEWQAAVALEWRSRGLGTGYWFAPRGPVFAPQMDVEASKDVLQELINKLQERLELRGRALFLRLEPVIQNPLHLPLRKGESMYQIPLLMKEGLGEVLPYPVAAMNPQHTLLLDLSPSWEEMQAAMHQKTRYNIRVAERKGVTVRASIASEDLECFLRLMDETAERDGFRSQPLSYIRQTFLYLAEQGVARIRLAEYEGACLAASMEVLYGDTVTYLYGASSSVSRETMAPYVLHAEAIQEAKKAGYRFYDWWGINPEMPTTKGYKASWEGITRFKRGWGGEVVSLPGTYDVPVYSWLYKAIFSRRALR